jgi:hypothetical protein
MLNNNLDELLKSSAVSENSKLSAAAREENIATHTK